VSSRSLVARSVRKLSGVDVRAELEDAPRAPMPARFDAHLATPVDQPPLGDEWLHELKYDGYRMAAFLDRGRARLVSRRGNDWTRELAELRAAVETLEVRAAVIDGEVVVLRPDGRTDFQALQNAFGGGTRVPLTYFAFDLLHLDGVDVSRLPTERRKALLRALLADADPRLRYAEHLVGRGEEIFARACEMGAEGIVSKRRDRAYESGRRPSWLKTKCVKRQEFVIGGFTDPEHSKQGIGALLVGVREGGGLRFAGKVGTGFTTQEGRALRQRLEALARNRPPFEPPPPGWLGRNAHWAQPELVAEVVFTEWTEGGILRHPSFRGLRIDKPASEVVRERPASVGVSVPHRRVYPDAGITRRELADYFDAVAGSMLPHLRGRPLTLVRCPGGLSGGCRFLHHADQSWAPDHVRRVSIREKTKQGEYLVVDDRASLLGLVEAGVLEFHTWNSTVDALEEPDRIVLDLDPGPEVPFTQVVGAARQLRKLLQHVGLESWVKTTGGAGLHVVIPLEPVASWTECLAFSRTIAQWLEREAPDRFSTAFAKSGREKKILVDYLRNNRTNTSVAAFSPRAREPAPVSVPIDWSELGPRLDPAKYTVRTVLRRLTRLRADPWARYFQTRQRLPGHRD
jgi:bifunctional non-homologous end joining protein LigD